MRLRARLAVNLPANDGRELFELRELAKDVRAEDDLGRGGSGKTSRGFCTGDGDCTRAGSPAVIRLSVSLSSDVSRSSMAFGCD